MRMPTLRVLAGAALILAVSTAWVVAAGQVPAAAGSDAARIRFNRDVRPIMSGTCFRCHGPDESSRMVGMRLDLREEALKPRPNGTPIVPGNPDASLIVQRIFATTPARMMPPVAIHKDLTQAQKETIRRWIAEGAEYEGHWAYQPVRRPAVPASAAPPSSPIDFFVSSRLRAEGLEPSPEADRRTLIRRVSLDLTGLAPITSGSGRVPGRSLAARVRTGGGPAAGVAPLRGEAGPLLARRRPIRRHGRLPRRQSLPGLALPRLRAQGVQCEQAL